MSEDSSRQLILPWDVLGEWVDKNRVALRPILLLPLVKASRKGDEEERGAFFRGFFLNLHKQERKLGNRRRRDLADQVLFWRRFDSHDQAYINVSAC